MQQRERESPSFICRRKCGKRLKNSGELSYSELKQFFRGEAKEHQPLDLERQVIVGVLVINLIGNLMRIKGIVDLIAQKKFIYLCISFLLILLQLMIPLIYLCKKLKNTNLVIFVVHLSILRVVLASYDIIEGRDSLTDFAYVLNLFFKSQILFIMLFSLTLIAERQAHVYLSWVFYSFIFITGLMGSSIKDKSLKETLELLGEKILSTPFFNFILILCGVLFFSTTPYIIRMGLKKFLLNSYQRLLLQRQYQAILTNLDAGIISHHNSNLSYFNPIGKSFLQKSARWNTEGLPCFKNYIETVQTSIDLLQANESPSEQEKKLEESNWNHKAIELYKSEKNAAEVQQEGEVVQ
jgi:hypothetical protein